MGCGSLPESFSAPVRTLHPTAQFRLDGVNRVRVIFVLRMLWRAESAEVNVAVHEGRTQADPLSNGYED